MLKLVALDLDGTTLNSAHRISDRTTAVLRKLSSMGVTIVIATGRGSDSVFGYVKELKLPQQQVPVVVFNGSVCLLYESATGEVRELFQKPIPAASAKSLIALADREGVCIQLYNGRTGQVYARPDTPLHRELLERYERLVERKQTYVNSHEEVFRETTEFAKALCLTFDPDAFMAAATAALPAGMLHMIRGSPDPFFVEFLRPDSNKGSAMLTLCTELGIDPSQVIAFGDGENDCEMLRAVGVGCAMAQARQIVKDSANIVTEYSNDQDGVAIQLEKFLEEGKFAVL